MSGGNFSLKGHNEVSPESSLIHVEPQLPQPVFIGEVLQPSDHLRGPPVDPLQQLHVFHELGATGLDAALRTGFYSVQQDAVLEVFSMTTNDEIQNKITQQRKQGLCPTPTKAEVKIYFSIMR